MNKDKFNKQLKKELEKRFGQEYVNKKITIIGLDDKGERRWVKQNMLKHTTHKLYVLM